MDASDFHYKAHGERTFLFFDEIRLKLSSPRYINTNQAFNFSRRHHSLSKEFATSQLMNIRVNHSEKFIIELLLPYRVSITSPSSTSFLNSS